MTYFARVGQVAAKVSGVDTTQDLSIAGLTAIPAFCRIVATYATANGVAATHGVASIGITDGSRQFVIGGASQDGVTPSNTWRTGDTAHIIQFINPSTGAVDGEAEIVGFKAGALEINWVSYPSSAYLLNFELRGGTFFTVRCDQFNLSVAENSEQQIDATFKPDQVEFYTTGGLIGGVPGTQHAISSGMADRQAGDGIAQFAVSLYLGDGQNPLNTNTRFHDNRSALVPSGSSINRSGELTSWLETPGDPVDGFGITKRDGGSDFDTFYAAFAYDTLAHDLILDTAPALIGLDVDSGYGFQPGSAYSMGSNATNLNANQQQRGTLFWGMWGPSVQASASRFDRSGNTPTISGSIDDLEAIRVNSDIGISMRATLASFDADGRTLNWLNTASGARYGTAYIEEGPPPPVGDGVPSAVKRRLREDD